jgi:tetratricopeptide (TPR) repeat protein
LSYGQSWRDSLLAARKAYFSKEYDRATKSYAYAEKAQAGKADLNSEKAQNAYRKGDFNSAVYHYKKGLRKANSTSKRVQSNFNIGNAFLKQKRYKEAIKAYKNALKMDPFNEQTRYNLSQALRKLKQSENKEKPKDQPKKKDPEKDKKDQKKQDQPKKDGSKPKDQQTEKKPADQAQGNKQRKRSADRMLNKLLKDEAATKRKLNNARIKRKGVPPSTEFDW